MVITDKRWGGATMTTNRVLKTIRWDPDVLQLGLKLAKQMYGSEKRLGYVCDDAIRLLYTHQTDPKQAEVYLSNVENLVVRSLEKRIEAVGRHATEAIEKYLERANKRIGNLYAREVYDSIKTYLMVEELCYRAMSDFKEVKPKIEKEAAQRMKRKLQYEGEQEGATYAEENARLREEVNRLQSELKRALERIQQQERESKRAGDQQARLEKLNDEVKSLKNEKNRLENWTRGLITYLQTNSGFTKSAKKLVEEYVEMNPKPRGV